MPRPARYSDPRRQPSPSQQGPRRHKHTDYTKEAASGTEEDLFALLETLTNPLLLILDQVTDPHNLGACLRTANAAGVAAVSAPKDHSAALTETVRHIACGAAEATPFIQVTNLARVMEKLKELMLSFLAFEGLLVMELCFEAWVALSAATPSSDSCEMANRY